MVNCSGSSTGAAMVDVDLGAGGGFGLGTAIACGGDAVARTSGVSDGLADECLCGLGDFSGRGVAFFFFDFGVACFAAEFFGLAAASGVSLGVGEVADSSAGGVFFFFGLGVGDFLFRGELFDFGVGVGDSSVVDEARAFKNFSRFSSSVDCP